MERGKDLKDINQTPTYRLKQTDSKVLNQLNNNKELNQEQIIRLNNSDCLNCPNGMFQYTEQAGVTCFCKITFRTSLADQGDTIIYCDGLTKESINT